MTDEPTRGTNPFGTEVRHVFLPYCIQQVADGRYVILNRNYKPLGFRSRERVDYEKYAVPLHITAKQAEKLSYKSSPDTKAIYFYNDGCVPTASAANMKSYLKRFDLFAKLKFKRRD